MTQLAGTALGTALDRAADGLPLDADLSATVFGELLDGDAPPAQVAGLLMAMRARGETVAELVSVARVLRARMVRVDAPVGVVDVVGTGGDGSFSHNISTGAALLTAGAGAPVGKHGNRAFSSRSGAADVLTALGVAIDLPPAGVTECIARAGIGFMFAPAHHPALAAVAPIRRELATRTVFNLLGPLLNPAGARLHLVGVHHRRWLVPMADCLRTLGSRRALVVCGSDGLDEITLSGPTHVVRLAEGVITEEQFEPDDFGLALVTRDDLVGGEPSENARALQDVLNGARGPLRDTLVANAAGALVAAGHSATLVAGVEAAVRSLDGGHAAGALDELRRVSRAAH